MQKVMQQLQLAPLQGGSAGQMMSLKHCLSKMCRLSCIKMFIVYIEFLVWSRHI